MRYFRSASCLDRLGKRVFWHSSAHVLGEAAEKHYGCHLCLGPPLDEGFYYEMAMEGAVASADYPALETLSKNAVKEKQRFERLVMKKEDLLEMFQVRTCVFINFACAHYVHSTTSISYISSIRRCPTARRRLCIVAGL